MRSPYSLLFFFLFALKAYSQNAADVIIKGGRILDGTGNSWFYGDIAIKDGRIIKIGQLNNYTAAKTIDARGLIVAPGFIDVHTHI